MENSLSSTQEKRELLSNGNLLLRLNLIISYQYNF